MILLMGGTKDARELVAAINAVFPRTMIVATAVSSYGAALLREQGGCVVLQGAMDATALTSFIREKEVRAVVDATHPFAEQVKEEAYRAASETGVAYLRYERPSANIPAGEGVYYVSDFTAAAQSAARLARVIFLTIGSRRLREFLSALPPEKKVVARVLPEEESIRQCREQGLSPAEIVALQGPVSQALNTALFTAYGAEAVVAKDSGETGGTMQKVAAAKACKIPIILVRRPFSRAGYSSAQQIISALKKIQD
ncbi:MAG: precorrin-6A reductase [Dethiobacter sp.]|jgi:precorrin-6A/cobalt-precorrin-6A reductase|nr:precorrin-6A reductase [Dethiobacter sp.]MBS3900360.1 precorrin-6A reductase [Dethiobacter sp.]MBS3983183.1 precorrin-6A reductase [Dethiobacter sp.]MCL4463422.1 precorrin-6A reductase [Bacillota bacterium]